MFRSQGLGLLGDDAMNRAQLSARQYSERCRMGLRDITRSDESKSDFVEHIWNIPQFLGRGIACHLQQRAAAQI